MNPTPLNETAYTRWLASQRASASEPVNPEYMSPGDLITVGNSPGIFYVTSIDNERGHLFYKPASKLEIWDGFGSASIRSCRLVKSAPVKGEEEQLTFPFLDQVIKDAIEERDQLIISERARLATKTTRSTSTTGARPARKSAATVDPLISKIQGLTSEKLAKLAELLASVKG